MVENDTSSVEYQLSTSTGPFTIPFYFIENGHISAWLYTENSDSSYDETTLTLDTDYTLTGAGNSDGGTLTLTEAHNGAILLITRTPDATQLTSYVATGKFPATSHERALDKLTMLIQQIYWWWDDLPLKRPNIFANFYHAKNRFIKYLKNPVDEQDAATKNYADGLYDGAISHADAQFKRTLRVPESSVNILPSINERKKKILAFNDYGNPIAVLPESGSAADVLINLG
ncbi:phage tail fiber protein, partial [Klebsiella pneumoniae]